MQFKNIPDEDATDEQLIETNDVDDFQESLYDNEIHEDPNLNPFGDDDDDMSGMDEDQDLNPFGDDDDDMSGMDEGYIQEQYNHDSSENMHDHYILTDDITDDDSSNQTQMEEPQQKLRILKKFPQITVDKLSKARFTKLNLELILETDVSINSLTDENVFEIMMTGLGNAQLPEKKPLSRYSLNEKFALFMMNENLSNHYSKTGVRFKESLFEDFKKMNNRDPLVKEFKMLLKIPAKLRTKDSLKVVFCSDSIASPKYFLSLEANRSIKKLFAFELLKSELEERQTIQKKLEKTIRGYEEANLELYEIISNITALRSTSSQEENLIKKIGFIHLALEDLRLEEIMITTAHKNGIPTPSTSPDDLKALAFINKSIPKAPKTPQHQIFKNMFRAWDKKGFAISSYTVDEFDKEIELRKKYLEKSINPEQIF